MGIKVTKGHKYIYTFKTGVAEGNADMRELLGGKGANLAEMCNLGLPVPAGVTISTEACTHYRNLQDEIDKTSFITRLAKQSLKQLKKLNTKKYLPLVSVRSGARVSMAGMMDTILNVGLTTDRFSELFPILGAHTVMDSYRRLQQMYGATVLGIPEEIFSTALHAVKEAVGASTDKDLKEDDLMSLIKAYDSAYTQAGKDPLDLTYEEQLAGAIRAVFDSWDNERAKVYRAHHNIPEEWGTAVNIQFMVFGNAHGFSGSGVMFTRDTTTGEDKPLGEFLVDAQGEDVVAGVRTPEPLEELAKISPDLHCKLIDLSKKLEAHYNDVQDIEFTIESGELYLLQTRDAKRTATAEIRIANDFVADGLWDICDLEEKLNPESFTKLSKPVLEPTDKNKVLAEGSGTGGVASGIVATSAAEGLKLKEEGKDFILWSYETTPNDLEAMLAAKAIVTEIGGQTCHAAVVARSLNLPCVVGTGVAWTGDQMVTVDADNGVVFSGLVPCSSLDEPEHVRELVGYIAESYGLVQHGQVIDETIYSLATKPVELTSKEYKEIVIDVSELGQELSKVDSTLLVLLGTDDDAYRCEIFKARLEGSPLTWLNDALKAGVLPTSRYVVAQDWDNLASLVSLILKALEFTKVESITAPDDLITGGKGTVDEGKLIDLLGGGVFEYLKAKAQEDGLYPEELYNVSTRTEIINALQGA